MSKKKDYSEQTDKYLATNGMVKIPYKDYLGQRRVKFVPAKAVGAPKVRGF